MAAVTTEALPLPAKSMHDVEKRGGEGEFLPRRENGKDVLELDQSQTRRCKLNRSLDLLFGCLETPLPLLTLKEVVALPELGRCPLCRRQLSKQCVHGPHRRWPTNTYSIFRHLVSWRFNSSVVPFLVRPHNRPAEVAWCFNRPSCRRARGATEGRGRRARPPPSPSFVALAARGTENVGVAG